jgi:hypothetical protein
LNVYLHWAQNVTRHLNTLQVIFYSAFIHIIDAQVIIMLNVLIAVVSDSYDYAMTRASGLFLRTRLVLVAELDALGLTREVILSQRLWSTRVPENCF